MENSAEEMVKEALSIKRFADSIECSDRELEVRANKFKAYWNRDWFVVVDIYEKL